MIPQDSKGLLLTVADTAEQLVDQTSINFDDFKTVISSSTQASTRVLILDCCFAGQALSNVLSDGSSLLANVVGELKEKHTAIIAAAGDYETAKRGIPMTTFTQALVDSLEEGVPGGAAELTVHDLYLATRQRLPTTAPRPRISSTGGESEMHFVRNAALTRVKPLPSTGDEARIKPKAPPFALADHARTLQRTLFVGAMDRELDYLKLDERMIPELSKGSFDSLKYHYLRHQGAKRWIDLSSHPAYAHTAGGSLQALYRSVCEFLNTSKPAQLSLLGLGCGDGKVDRELLQILCDQISSVQEVAYFPIDVSVALLQRAAREVGDNTELKRVAILPIAAELQNLGNVVRMWQSSTHVEIYSLLGCTFGNFRNEQSVLRPIADAMRQEDVLLLDARCYGGEMLLDEQAEHLLAHFNHSRNTAFALGPLLTLRRRGESKTGVRVTSDKRVRNDYSAIKGTRSILTELTLDEDWRSVLYTPEALESLVLSWSNVYQESSLVSWLTETLDFEIAAQSPLVLRANEIGTVAFMLTKRALSPGAG